MTILKNQQRSVGGDVYWIDAPGPFHSGTLGNDELSLSKLAKKLGVGWPTLLYYELRGLTRRTRIGGKRVYHCAEADRVAFIVRCRQIGLPLRDIRPIIAGARSATLAEAGKEQCCVLIERLQQKLLETDDMIGELERRYTALLSRKWGASEPAKLDQIPANSR